MKTCVSSHVRFGPCISGHDSRCRTKPESYYIMPWVSRAPRGLGKQSKRSWRAMRSWRSDARRTGSVRASAIAAASLSRNRDAAAELRSSCASRRYADLADSLRNRPSRSRPRRTRESSVFWRWTEREEFFDRTDGPLVLSIRPCENCCPNGPTCARASEFHPKSLLQRRSWSSAARGQQGAVGRPSDAEPVSGCVRAASGRRNARSQRRFRRKRRRESSLPLRITLAPEDNARTTVYRISL